MNVDFMPNNDGITCSMLVENKVIVDEIPYVPEKCVDHRGLYLYLLGINDYILPKNIPNKSEIDRGFEYMNNPIFVKQAIKNFKNRI